MKIQGKIIAMGVTLVVLTTAAIVGITHLQEKRIGQSVTNVIENQARQETAKVARNIHLMCEVMRESVTETVLHNLKVTEALMHREGDISFASEKVRWVAVNQFTKETKSLLLPKMLLGNQWFGQNRDAEYPTPLVDEVERLAGGTTSVFQRMNEQGDMLRIATNVLQNNGMRAIGTYIPAENPDGTPNEVITAVMRGETFLGRAFVVNAWYITAYQPIWDKGHKEVIGVLYYGAKQENVASLRQGVKAMQVGQTGEVFILGGKNKNRGIVQISRQSKLEGTSLWDFQDSRNGRFFIRSLVDKALALHTESETDIPVAFERFEFQHKGEKAPRLRTAAVTYFEPSDWVIVAIFNEDDLQAAQDSVKAGLFAIIRSTMTVAALVLVVAVIVGLIMARSISKPLKQTLDMILDLEEGNLDQRLNFSRSDEIGEIAGAVDHFADNLQEEIHTAFDKLAHGDFTFKAKGLIAKPLARANIALNELVQEIQDIANQVASCAADVSSEITIPLPDGQSEPNGHDLMDGMAQTVAEMNASAEDISKIIKIVDEIAFQTNLLTLNSAMVATRDGQQSKGFAAVAEEVRTLAARSARAAKETADLIESTGDSNGSELADHTAQTLRKIVAGIGKITDLASEIAVASREKSLGITLYPPTQPEDNDATEHLPATQESTDSAKTLAEQAQRLKQLLGNFKVMQKNNLAAWTELRAQAITRKAQKQSRRSPKPSETAQDEET
ncbi:methyl-accepting chemotaxis sensory transducer, class 36H [Syntrophotalea carbinolica DSM 2380]|uniref:Methyl-accepting chemotaxis sensory transducer, class 36H n=1 Tax=Syntrophotalea carbinolica (strain DSM 2380 / NBRC 103641 / GraBd1) TaxID=338963 RepID=Q3A1Q1_SYNC1|nr:methyl-accepting chemotaxis protein [Syntrophotalea carbinolica]ABA89706.1 methyl-accepting chemotaxis sensory transducer, class 36H [Syntrophotalea carbinolica DSM 2380]